MSGLKAASNGLKTTAHNIANANTAGFRPSRVQFAALPNGDGVRVAQIAPEPGATASVDLTDQMLRMIRYAQQFEAQASVVRAVSENALHETKR
ncbi:MAG: flagellar basal body protein [Pseudomonadota bacterium]